MSIMRVCMGVWAAAGVACGASTNIWVAHSDTMGEPLVYRGAGGAPAGGPARSDDFAGIHFTGRYANYTRADTWYPSWASDGNLYSPWTDGTIGEMPFVWSARYDQAETGHAKISGDDPLHLTVSDWGTQVASALPYRGRYPCGSLVHDGVWYYGTYALDQPVDELCKSFGWYVMGPFVGFRISTDQGKTWTESPRTPARPLFDEPSRGTLDLAEGKHGPFIKMGAPHVVDFGKNMEHSPDGKAYLVGHGAETPDPMPRRANNSWVTGDAVYMARVTPGIETMNDPAAYEFFAGRDADGAPIWSRDYSEIAPIFSWNNHCGIATITYNPGLDTYFMCVTDGHDGSTSREKYSSYLLESDHVTGPWRMVAHMEDFGPQAYFLNIVSKFTSDDGETMWLSYSANYMYAKRRNDAEFIKTTTPGGSAYSLSLHEFKVEHRSE